MPQRRIYNRLQAEKGIVREQRRANVEYATKQIAKYSAEKVLVKKAVTTSIIRFSLGVAGGTMVNNHISHEALLN